jgi:hypothetical protein
MPGARTTLEQELVGKYGEAVRERAVRGLRQAASMWRESDGDSVVFGETVRNQFAGTQADHDSLFVRLEEMFEHIGGHLTELGRHLRVHSDLALGPMLAVDDLLAGFDPSAHVTEDLFANKIAFSILLNFPVTTLNERLEAGERWTRRQWAEARLTRGFTRRIPAEVHQAIALAAADAARYVAGYNIWMHHVVDGQGTRHFPEGLRLLSHWNLRDEIKANYAEGNTGLPKQRLIQKVMERIVTQSIPACVVDNPSVDWDPMANTVVSTRPGESERGGRVGLPVSIDREPDTRYRILLETFLASRREDPFSPSAPTLIARRFEEDRELPEKRVEAMLKQVLSSPLVPKVAALISERLGRPLEPFDVWYNGFRARGTRTEEELDGIVRKKYPTAAAYQADMPRLFEKLGFSQERAAFLASHIEVDPARGSGHAMGAAMRSAKARLRTRVEQAGMNYKGYNIAVHEMGHNVEQVISLHLIDHTLLAGVPNTAFTEALAFVFQGHDMELLGFPATDARANAFKTLDDFWGAYEISGVALVDMAVWHWMYDHPGATPAQVKDATLGIAKTIWNTYYAPVFGIRDVVLLGVYSHMIDSFLYLPDYPIGHLIAHQIEERMRSAGAIGPEFERMASAGAIAPDLWMKNATGAPVGAEALLGAAERAYGLVRGSR